MIDRKKTLDIVENLIETCHDGQNGFREAAEHISDHAIRSFFNEQSLERARFAADLEAYADRQGEPDVHRGGSVPGAIHRAWIDLKANLGLGDEGILKAAEAGEDHAKKAYEDAQKETLPADLQEIVSHQARSVIAAHDRVKAYRDRKAA